MPPCPRRTRLPRWLIAAAAWVGVAALAAAATVWLPLAKDGVHDPRGPGIGLLQQPAEALSTLPPDTAGNMVR